MSERAPTAGNADDEPGGEADAADDAREAALIRKVIRMQERHREGGVDPELDDDDEAASEPDAQG